MKTLRTIVVDDEPASRKGLVKLLQAFTRIKVVGEAHDAGTFVKCMQDMKPDLVFLDIMLRDTNSLDVMHGMDFDALFVMTTAYGQHALRSYDIRAIDYLMKPLAPERIASAIERAVNIASASVHTSADLFLKADGRYHKFRTGDILFIQGMENYVVVQTVAGRLVCKMTMTGIRHLLPENTFMQVHKSYIVNLSKVDALEKQNIYLQSHVLPISREKKQEVYRKLLGISPVIE